MDVHFHLGVGDREEENISGFHPLFQEGFIGRVDRLYRALLTNQPSVNEEYLGKPSLLFQTGLQEKPLQAQVPPFVLVGTEEAVPGFPPINLEEAVSRVLHRFVEEDLPTIRMEGESHGRVGKGHAAKEGADAPALGGDAPEEVASGGKVVEELLHPKPGPSHEGLLLWPLQEVPSLHLYPVTGGVSPLGGEEGEPGDLRNARQGLSPEPQGGHCLQILHLPDLGGRVTLDGQRELFRSHPLSIVLHLDQPSPPLFEAHLHPLRSGVQGVFHQLLHHGEGVFDHLPGRDLAGDLRRQF